MKLKLFEAFAGYGSQSLALERFEMEFEHVGICEIDKYAIEAHKALHGPVKNYGDISKVNPIELPDMDLFTYSFPCQDISVAGKGRGFDEDSGTRSSLLWECRKIIITKRPRILMLENVKNLVGKSNRPHFEKWLDWLESQGYNNYWEVLNAKWCGVPQNRERVFCVSILKEYDDGTFKFNEQFDNGLRLKDILELHVGEKYYLPDEKVERLVSKLIESGELQRPFLVEVDGGVEVRQATQKGFELAVPGDSVNIEQPNSKTRRGRVGKGVAQTLTTSCNQCVVEPQINQIGNLIETESYGGNPQSYRVYDPKGIAPTLNTCGGGRERA